MMNRDTLDEEDIIMIEVEDHQIEEIIKREVIQEVEGHQTENPLLMVDPLMMMDPQMMADPLMMEGLLMIEDPQEMEDLQDDLEDKDHQAPQVLLDQCVLS